MKELRVIVQPVVSRHGTGVGGLFPCINQAYASAMRELVMHQSLVRTDRDVVND